MRRIALVAILVLAAAGAHAQDGTSTWQMQFDQASITAAKAKLALAAGAMEWNSAKPEQSTIALSLDATSIADDGVKSELDAQHFPEIRIISAAPGRMSGGKVALPTQVTVKDVIKPVMLQITYKAEGRQLTVHAEGVIKAGDFKLKGGDIPLVIDAPFKPASGE